MLSLLINLCYGENWKLVVRYGDIWGYMSMRLNDLYDGIIVVNNDNS